jgi:hypothetical protein
MSAEEFRAAAAAKDANQARWLLALAGARDDEPEGRGADHAMDRQTPRDWVHAFDARGIDALIDDTSPADREANRPACCAGRPSSDNFIQEPDLAMMSPASG